jgi:spoIIIJ-associated protein
MAKENKKQEKLIKDFFVSLGIDAEIVVAEDEEAISVVLETEDTGIIIGYHGETLESLQLILSLLLAKANGEFKRVSVEVGDYKKNRTEWLERLAVDAKERALSEGKEVYLSELKSWERRVVHLLLQDDKEVVSESSGEGKDRVLVVKPR